LLVRAESGTVPGIITSLPDAAQQGLLKQCVKTGSLAD
jgi:hypothetical protein